MNSPLSEMLAELSPIFSLSSSVLYCDENTWSETHWDLETKIADAYVQKFARWQIFFADFCCFFFVSLC
jgi:hypothetical protein